MRRRARLGVRASVTIRCASRLALRARTPRASFASARSSPMKASALSQVQRPRRRRPRDASYVRLSTSTLAFVTICAWHRHAKQRAPAPLALSDLAKAAAPTGSTARRRSILLRELLCLRTTSAARPKRRALRAVANCQAPAQRPSAVDQAVDRSCVCAARCISPLSRSSAPQARWSDRMLRGRACVRMCAPQREAQGARCPAPACQAPL